jgi:hypothetical protein
LENADIRRKLTPGFIGELTRLATNACVLRQKLVSAGRLAMPQNKLLAAHKAEQLHFFGNQAKLTNARTFAAYVAPLCKIEWGAT